MKFLVSVEQQSIASPFPLRLTLHLHNSGQTPLWLYSHVQDPATLRRSDSRSMSEEEESGNRTKGGSMLTVRLEPLGAAAQPGTTKAPVTPAAAKVLASVGMPRPRLVRLAPGEDYEEKAVIRCSPALARVGDKDEPVWGRYRLTARYGAQYSNGDEASRNLDVVVWQGEVSSNTIEFELKPTPTSDSGSAAGTVKSAQNQPVIGELVSLSDRQERLVDQTLTDIEGRFSFDRLPLGLYWVTVRRPDATVETTTFRHIELTSASTAGSIDILLLPTETYEPKQMLHKPVLFRVVNADGQPAGRVALESTWSSGTVLDNVKGDTAEDGTVTLNLIPGRNYLALRQRGCPKQEQRVDVSRGEGFDDFKLILECK